MTSIEELKRELVKVQKVNSEQERKRRLILESKRDFARIQRERGELMRQIKEAKNPGAGRIKKDFFRMGRTGIKALKLISNDISERQKVAEKREAIIRARLRKKKATKKKPVKRRRVTRKRK